MVVLVVEDEEKIAEFLRKGLVEAGYEVDVVTHGEEAVRESQMGTRLNGPRTLSSRWLAHQTENRPSLRWPHATANTTM